MLAGSLEGVNGASCVAAGGGAGDRFGAEARRVAVYTGLTLALLFVSIAACPGDRTTFESRHSAAKDVVTLHA